ncbi:MAG: hypothetical protein HYY06_29190 [Deltaproteobacteria bacterium]|nr:hypothetical protein [Deltaproteobacteria bacterium]
MSARVIVAAGIAALSAGCQCGFDDAKIRAIECTVEADCPPGRDCIDGYCQGRRADGGVPGEDSGPGVDSGPSVDGGPGTDAGVDAAVPCEDVTECDDGLGCTVDVCAESRCIHDVDPGRCAVDGECWSAGDVNPLSPCEECTPDENATRWTADDGNSVDDGVSCTLDSCKGGVESHEPDDAACDEGEICAACAGGCVAGGWVVVACDELPGTPGGDGASCTVAAPGGPAACLVCSSLMGITSLVRQDFDGCNQLEQLGWEESDNRSGRFDCNDVDRHLGPDIERNEDAVEIEDGEASISRTVDTTDLDSVRLCFDYADRDAEETDTLAVEIDTGGGWQTIWSDGGGPVPDVDLHWQNVCLDLTAADPLAAGNAALQIRFSADVSGGRLYLDNVTIDAWDAGTVTWPGRVFSDDFGGCELGGWSIDEGEPSCPIAMGVNAGREALEVTNDDLSLSRTVDLSSRCDDVRMGFAFGTRQHGNDHGLHVSYLRGGGGRSELLWSSYRGLENAEALVAFETSVSSVHPQARFDGDLGLEVRLEGGSGSLYLDDVWLDGAECQSGDGRLNVSEPVVSDNSGAYAVTVTSAERATGYLECTWAGRAASAGRAQILFCGNPAECRPGQTDSRQCGECGSEERACREDCMWEPWSQCADLPCNCCDAYGSCSACCC